MNWLAHIFISRNSIDHQLGNLLADPLKGKSWTGASQQLEDGYKMHSSIDSFADTNAIVLKSKLRLGSKGHLRSVIVDIAYDYCLTKNWNHYSKVELQSFMNTFYQNANKAIEDYPDHARMFVQRLIDTRVLTSYGSFRGLETAFERIDSRLSERLLAKESALGYSSALKREIAGIEEDFLQFFPQLIEHFKSKEGTLSKGHWLR